MATITPLAVFPTAATAYTGGSNPYSGTFIPTLWSGKLIEKFYDATVLAAISNTDYEGEISNYGDKVIIRQKPGITVRDYTAGNDDGTRLTYEKPNADSIQLLIDQGKYWGTELDDVMEVQSDVDQLSMWADDASEQMKIEIDTDCLTFLHSGADGATAMVAAANRGLTAGRLSADINLGNIDGSGGESLAVSKSNVTDIIVDAGTVLDEQNIPESGRWMVIPAWMAGRIKKSELSDASLSGDGSSILRNGRLGVIDRFTLYMSNLVPNGTALTTVGDGAGIAGEFACFFGHSSGLTFASQVTKTETLRVESTFGTIMRGLQVYGRQVVKSEALGLLIVNKG